MWIQGWDPESITPAASTDKLTLALTLNTLEHSDIPKL